MIIERFFHHSFQPELRQSYSSLWTENMFVVKVGSHLLYHTPLKYLFLFWWVTLGLEKLAPHDAVHNLSSVSLSITCNADVCDIAILLLLIVAIINNQPHWWPSDGDLRPQTGDRSWVIGKKIKNETYCLPACHSSWRVRTANNIPLLCQGRSSTLRTDVHG